jgi:hypothetical protein
MRPVLANSQPDRAIPIGTPTCWPSTFFNCQLGRHFSNPRSFIPSFGQNAGSDRFSDANYMTIQGTSVQSYSPLLNIREIAKSVHAGEAKSGRFCLQGMRRTGWKQNITRQISPFP